MTAPAPAAPKKSGLFGITWLIWIASLILVGGFLFFYLDVPDQVTLAYQRMVASQQTAEEPAVGEVADLDEEQNTGDAASEEAAADSVQNAEEATNAGAAEAGPETERRVRPRQRPRPRATPVENEEDGSENCTQMDGFRRCASHASLTQAPCITDLRYTRVPAQATDEIMDRLTQRLVRSACTPRPGEEPVPEEGCRGEGSQQACWAFRRIESPPAD